MNRDNLCHSFSQPSVFLPVMFPQVMFNCVSIYKLSLVTLCHQKQREYGQPQSSCSVGLKRSELTNMQNKISKKFLTHVFTISRFQNASFNHFNQKVLLGQVIHILVYPCFVLNPKFPLLGFIARNLMSYLLFFLQTFLLQPDYLLSQNHNIHTSLHLPSLRCNMLFYIFVLNQIQLIIPNSL